MNILEGLLQNPNMPKMAPHVGEVFAMWTYFAALANSRSMCLVLTNHTADPDLQAVIERLVHELEEPQIKHLTQVMKTEGIPFPPSIPDHPSADEKTIPFGAKFSETEIANLLVVKLEGMLFICHYAISQALRDDVGMMFYQFQGQLLKIGMALKKVMQTRGWLLVPPPFTGGTTSHRPTE